MPELRDQLPFPVISHLRRLHCWQDPLDAECKVGGATL